MNFSSGMPNYNSSAGMQLISGLGTHTHAHKEHHTIHTRTHVHTAHLDSEPTKGDTHT